MHLYLLRHGIAVDRDHPAYLPDPERPLTEEGKEGTRAAARGLRAIGVEPDVVLSSPYRRARQTAEITAEELGIGAHAVREVNALVPMGDPDDVLAALANESAASVLCAGHAPNLDRVIARVAGAPRVFTALGRASLAILALGGTQPGQGELVALYPARTLLALAT